jgi:hypothetical protein
MLTAIAATEGDVHDGGDFIWLERSTATAETADAPAADPSREEDQPYPHQLVLALGFPTTEEYNFLLLTTIAATEDTCTTIGEF